MKLCSEVNFVSLECILPYFTKIEGKICGYAKCERMAVQLASKIKIPWVHNGLRHGFGSCRVAITKNYPQVAYEMGNTVDVIKADYDQVVTEREAEKWFAISP